MNKSYINYSSLIIRDSAVDPLFKFNIDGLAEVKCDGYLLVPLERIVGMEDIRNEDYKDLWERYDALGPLVQVNISGSQILKIPSFWSRFKSLFIW